MFFKQYPVRNSYTFLLPQVRFFHVFESLILSDINIYTEPSYHDCHSDDHRFNSFHCNGMTMEQGWAIGLEVISLLKGLARLFYHESDVQQVCIKEMINSESSSVSYPNHNLGYDIQLKPFLFQSISRQTVASLSPLERRDYYGNARENIFNAILFVSQTSPGIYLLLKYLAEDLTWGNLYKIMETLETIQKHYDAAWQIPYSNAQKKKFTNPANNFSLIGINSRHGFKLDSLQQNNAPQMQIHEAQEMFKDAVKDYFNFKFNELRQTKI